MKLNEYQQRAQRTAQPGHPQRLAVAALGLVGEAGEFAEHVKKHLGHGHDLSQEAAGEELGDLLWYVQECASAIGLTLEEIAARNLAKLERRYPDGFSQQRSRDRGVAR